MLNDGDKSALQYLPEKDRDQISAAYQVIRGALGERVYAVYLYGSALGDGLKPLSDLDILVVIEGQLGDSLRQALQMDLLAVSAPPGEQERLRALEVTVLNVHEVLPWRYPPKREFQFGEWLRGNLLRGIFEPVVHDHDLAILLTKVRQNSLPLWGPPAGDLFEPVPREDFNRALSDTITQWNVEADWQGDERNVVLALARVWYSAATGEIAAKETAAAWVASRLPDEHKPILDLARAAYLAGDDRALSARKSEMLAFVRYAKSGIAQLLGSL